MDRELFEEKLRKGEIAEETRQLLPSLMERDRETPMSTASIRRALSGAVLRGATAIIGEGNNTLRLNPNQGLWVGNANFDDAPFRVSIGGDIALSCSTADAITIGYGSDILLEHGGDIKFTSVTAPTACTAALAGDGAGNVDNGIHKYRITYVNATGETELGAVSNAVTVTDKDTDGKVVLTGIPTSSSGSVTSRKIYRTKAGGNAYYLLTTIADNTTTTYTDNTADAGLTGGAANYHANDTFGKIITDDVEAFGASANNTLVGQKAGKSITTDGNYNTFVGSKAGEDNTEGSSNVFLGFQAGENNTSGDNNTYIGIDAGRLSTTGSKNTFVGDSAGYQGNATSSVFLGFQAGCYETGSNKLIIDNTARANEADARAKALIYGEFSAIPTSQSLSINGMLSLPYQSSARAYLGTDQTGVSNLTWTKVELDSESWDTRGEMDTTTNHRFTATDAGKYLVVAGIAFSAAVTTYGWIAIYVNGAQLRLGPKTEALGGKVLTNISAILDLDAGDYIELWGYFNSDGAEDIESGSSLTYLEISKIA